MDEHTIDLHRSIVYTKNAVYRFKWLEFIIVISSTAVGFDKWLFCSLYSVTISYLWNILMCTFNLFNLLLK